MGKGKCAHEMPIEYLRQAFGKGESTELKTIYNDEYRRNHNKCTSLTADYVGNTGECNAYVDVFSKGDEWRQIMGKVVAYSYEIQQTGSNKEVWLVSVDLSSDHGWTDWYRRAIQVVRDIMPTNLQSRIHYKDFKSEDQKFTEIPLDISFKG